MNHLKQGFLNTVSQKKWFYPLLIVLLWLIAIVFIDPRGEFPINDDWAYAKNVKSWVVDGKFYVDEWPAMTLISQTLYGSAVTAVFGFSFTALRCSILLLGVLASLVLFFIFRKRGADDFISFFLSSGFCFSQVFMALSFTYMTDVFFLSFVIFSVYQLLLYLDGNKKVNYILYCLFSVIAVLNRQQGLLLPLLIIAPLLLQQKFSFRNLMNALLPLMLCTLAHLGYRRLLEAMDVYYTIWSADKLLTSLAETKLEALHWHAGDTFLFSGLLLVPMSVYFWFTRSAFSYTKLAGVILSVAVIALVGYTTLPLFPSGNISNIKFVGPHMLKDFFENFILQNDLNLTQKWWVRIIAFVSSVTMFYHAFNFRRYIVRENGRATWLNFSFFLFACIYFAFSVFNPSYMDRYVLPFACIVLILCVRERLMVRKFAKPLLVILLSAIFLLSVLTEKDCINWHRARWQAVEALHAKGVSPKAIDGGFEYGGWYKPGKGFYADSDNRSWWWVDQDSFLIADGPYPGFEKQQFFTYQHFVPFTSDTVFILKKIQRNESYFIRIREIELHIRADSVWLNGIKQQAIDLNKPLDTLLRINAKWILDNEKPEGK